MCVLLLQLLADLLSWHGPTEGFAELVEDARGGFFQTAEVVTLRRNAYVYHFSQRIGSEGEGAALVCRLLTNLCSLFFCALQNFLKAVSICL